ncbi:MAG: transketolase [Gammaproteobacteria bacterium]|nr:transketolase [Gammaproteobacteria bacterium]
MPTTRELANAIRFLSLDAIQKANSGHPGMPLGMADIATVLWRDFLQHNPQNPHWLNRDRFMLSNGHGSMLHYALLHLTGYDLSIDEIKNFRQLHSKTPGHPEVGLTPGIETTTGPLGQGLANAVGMCIAEKALAATFNRPSFNIIDHYTYVFVGDGCLMEGISHEACSLAGTLGLGKLIAFWDDNGISIDGHVTGWFTENIPERFAAYNWHVVKNVDSYDAEALKNAILEARSVNDRPSLICCKTTIGFGAPNVCGTHNCHGAALGEKEVQATRENLHWNYPAFVIPEEIYAAWNAKEKGAKIEKAWDELFIAYQKEFPTLASELMRRVKGDLPKDWTQTATKFIDQTQLKIETLATRQASQKCLEAFAPILPELFGGSADLTASNLTNWSGSVVFNQNSADGNYLHYGVREFGMFGIMNGIALHGGFIPYGGTFLVFAGYGIAAIRMAALMSQRVIYVFSHDSIGLGEDGPTHQPIEHLTMLRTTPNLSVWRPCDATETAIAWQAALERNHGPTALVLTRQKVVGQERDSNTLSNIKRGGYVLKDCIGQADCIIIATGSEVQLAVNAAKKLTTQGKKIRVVSMPSTDVFVAQDKVYQESVLPSAVTRRVVIEAAHHDYWHKFVGANCAIIGIDRYGASAPDKVLFEFFGFTEENVVNKIISLF